MADEVEERLVPPLMLAKLSEKQGRQQRLEQRRAEAAECSLIQKLWLFITGIKSFMSFLLVGRNFIRAGVIMYSLLGVVFWWVVDWMVYPWRRLSSWRILSRISRGEGMSLVPPQEGYATPFSQGSLSIYETQEKPIFARRLMIAFQNLGPAFIKLGQLISMLPVLPRSFTSEFAKLCDYLPTESIEQVRALIEKGLGAPPEEIFEYIDPEPIGSASLAQVHSVVLKDGRDAVIKVQRPDLKAQFDRDYTILGPIAGLLQIILKILSPMVKMVRDIRPVEILRDYGDATAVDELDFGLEASVMQMHANALKHYGLSGELHIPNVYWEYTTENLITMERMWTYFKLVDIDVGRPEEIDSCLEFIKGLGYNPSLMFKKCERARWHVLSRYGVANLDTHHGNLLYCYDDVLGLVDFGINFWGGASPEVEKMRCGIIQAWKGVASQDADEILEAARDKLGVLKGLDDEQAIKVFAEELQRVLEPLLKVTERSGAKGEFLADVGTFTRTPEFAKLFLDLILGMARRASVKLSYELLAFLRRLPYGATWIRIVDPAWNLFTEGDSIHAYWFGPDDGKVPYKGTNIYPEPYLPHEPEIFFKPRSEEQVRADDLSLCFAPLKVSR
jgi:predicted unusual protein kinase regulating ubiquinone biosynthesis (AarF/ABC1/UbiB family)